MVPDQQGTIREGDMAAAAPTIRTGTVVYDPARRGLADVVAQ